MIKDLTLKPYTYKALRINNNPLTPYEDIQGLLGGALITTKREYESIREIKANVDSERLTVPIVNEAIIVAEFFNNGLTGLFVADTPEELEPLFDWEGEL